jgi:hypothetical protein
MAQALPAERMIQLDDLRVDGILKTLYAQIEHARTTAIRTQTLHLKYEVPQFHATLGILKAERIVDAIRLCPDNEGI